jgi:hypothetical protein
MSLRSRANQRTLIGLILITLLAGCATPSRTVKQIDRLDAVDENNPKLLVMTPDVKYYLLTAGGVSQPHGDWTNAARRNFEDALVKFARGRDTDLVMIPDDINLGETEIAYQKLYSAVGVTILSHYYGALKLPTKQGSFDWSLGSGVREIGEKYEADYALFSYYRDYQASGGRVAFAVLAAVAGVGMATGSESGFAALVDLNTGDIVWFNVVSAGSGELRDSDGAHAVVRQLFKDLPES